MNRLCVYCGSSFGRRGEYVAAAQEVGRACAQRGLTIIYGGGNVGLMGAMADAALHAGGKVIGVIPSAMVQQERAHRRLTELIVVENMHQRKQRMADLADGFVALPGGIGTLEELMEMFTWLQLGIHLKPLALLNIADYYGPLIGFLQRMREEGFLTARRFEQLIVESEVGRMLESMMTARLVHEPKPIYRKASE